MSFAIDGSVITQTSADTSLAGIEALAGASVVTLGKKKIYTIDSGTTLNIEGTLTINPEVERLDVSSSEDNNAVSTVIFVKDGGLFNFGTTITLTVNGKVSSRFSLGVAVNSLTRQRPWYNIIGGVRGKGATIVVESGGSMHWRGATLGGRASFSFDQGCTGWIQDGIFNHVLGVEGTEQNGGGRDTISYFATSDLLINGFTIVQGAEIIFYQRGPSGTNSLSGTANGIFGYSAKQAFVAAFPSGFSGFELVDSELANNGNKVDVTIQSTGLPNNVRNELGGSEIFFGAPESGTNSKNCGIGNLFRRINFDLADGLTEATLSDGRYFFRDTNNGDRKNANSQDDTADKTYSGTFTSGAASSDVEILIGVVNAVCGIARVKNQSNDPASTNSEDTPFKMDKRTKSNILGNDKMDGVIWRYENQFLSLADVDLTDDTVGTKIIRARAVADTSITSNRAAVTTLNTGAIGTGLTFTSSAMGITQTTSLDDIYDIVKWRKELTDAGLELPSATTMVVDSNAGDLDFNALTLTVTGKITTGTTHQVAKHDSTLSFDDFNLSNLGIEAPALTTSNSTLTIPAGCKPVGTMTRSSNITITAANDADVSGLILAGTGTYTLIGLPANAYSASSTATTVDTFSHNIVIDTSAVSATTFYRVLTGSTLATISNSVTFGSVTGATNSHTINLSSASITGLNVGDPLVVVITSNDGTDVRHVTTVQDTTDNITINANAAYNSGATVVAGDVAISVTTVDSAITAVTYTLLAGISLGSADTNKSFNSIRSTQNYCDFIAFIGTGGSIVNSSQNATQLDAATNKLSTIIDGTTTTAAAVQGLSLDNGAALSTIFTAATFTGTGSIGLTLTADTAVDYAAVGSTVKAVVKDPMIKASKFIPLGESDF